ncbi:DUF308 domain-containing protein [Streptococcus mitis]|uniref:DUF308 domain-containing protein n=1 Tax=Streptococcus mitis TaxID=28037 RepID=UPI003B20EAD7
MSKIWKWLLLIAGIFAVFVGFNMFAHPLISLASMTFWFALVFAVQGISEIVQYFKSEEKRLFVNCSGLKSAKLEKGQNSSFLF